MVEGTISVLMQALCGANLVHDVGFLESGLTSSFEMLVTIDEVIAMINQIVKPVEITDETLALDVIHDVGPGGNFLAEEHTAQHFRTELWTPTIFERSPWDSWMGQKGRSLVERAALKVQDILEVHQPEPMDEAMEREIDAIVESARKNLL